MTGPDNISKIQRLRARDGDRCWLCHEPIDFDAKPNSARAWSVEHLISKSLGGPQILDNLVLCHPGCNRTLANRPLTEKIRLREKRRRKMWLPAIRGQIIKVLAR